MLRQVVALALASLALLLARQAICREVGVGPAMVERSKEKRTNGLRKLAEDFHRHGLRVTRLVLVLPSLPRVTQSRKWPFHMWQHIKRFISWLMALPASDSFTNTNATALSTHNAGWTMAVSNWEIRDNKANTTVDSDSYAFWNADSFNANQYSKASVAGMSSFAEYRGVCARAAGTAGSFRCYLVYTDGSSGAGHTEIGKVTAGTYSTLKTVATTFATDDVIEIRCTGTTPTTIALYKNGALVDSTSDASSPYTTGAAGLYSYGNTPGLDNWQADNLSVGGSSVAPLAQAHYRRRRG